jgi:hypothetical protein
MSKAKLQPDFQEAKAMEKDNKVKSVPAVREAAAAAGRAMARWNAVETDAARVHEEGQGRAIARALFTPDGSHHVILQTGGTTMEIKDGAVAVTIAAKE